MRAIVFDQPGGAEVLRYGEAPDPTPKADEILVRVHAAALNRADLLQRRGMYPPPADASPLLGLELAGEVIQAAGEWEVGDRVMAVVTGGAYAELAALPADTALYIPNALTYEQAAAIPEAFLTAYLNMFTLGHMQPFESILIHAGASGVGTAAIQLARIIGAKVFVTAGSDEKLEFCRSLGATVTINYKTESFAQRIKEETNGRGVDVILDFIGASYWDANLTSLALNGRMMFIGSLGGTSGQLDIGQIMYKNLTITGTTLRRTPHDKKAALVKTFKEFALPYFEAGELRPVVDKVFPIEEASAAHQYMESNANTGKIVLTVKS